MCLTVYLASPAPLPAVEWSAARPGFNAGPLTVAEESVRGVVSLPNIAFVGSHTHCGCGFVNDGAEDPAAVRRSRAELASYAATAVLSGPAELYVCWNGEADATFAQQLTLTPGDLVERDDWLAEGTLVRLVP